MRISRTRLSGWRFTSERIDEPLPGLWLVRTAQARQNKHSASADQTDPFASFHPLFEGRQHAIRPNLWFSPGPPGPSFSSLFSLFRHYRWFFSAGLSFTHPPSCIPLLHAHYRRFITTMDALTPDRLSPPARSPRLTHDAFHPFRLQPPDASLQQL